MAGQPSSGPLGPDQTQQMIWFAVRRPSQNPQFDRHLRNTDAGIRAGNSNFGMFIVATPPQSARLSSYVNDSVGISVTLQLIAFPGRLLNGPVVRYGGEKDHQYEIRESEHAIDPICDRSLSIVLDLSLDIQFHHSWCAAR